MEAEAEHHLAAAVDFQALPVALAAVARPAVDNTGNTQRNFDTLRMPRTDLALHSIERIGRYSRLPQVVPKFQGAPDWLDSRLQVALGYSTAVPLHTHRKGGYNYHDRAYVGSWDYFHILQSFVAEAVP